MCGNTKKLEVSPILGSNREVILASPFNAGLHHAQGGAVTVSGKSPAGSTTGQGSVKRRVMVVDDNKDAAISLSMLLRKHGHEVATEHDGAAALEKGREFKPDVVIMDIGMPKLNGYEACTAMRGTEWGKGIRIVALSGWGQEEDRRRSNEAGFDRHFVKPIDRATVLDIVS